MITLDINSNYCDRGGGIRTYHQAKIAWFNRHRGGPLLLRRSWPAILSAPRRPARGADRSLWPAARRGQAIDSCSITHLRGPAFVLARVCQPRPDRSWRPLLYRSVLPGPACLATHQRPGDVLLSFRPGRNLGRPLGQTRAATSSAGACWPPWPVGFSIESNGDTT